MKFHVLFSGPLSQLTRLLLLLVFSCLSREQAQSSIMYFAPNVLGAAGGTTAVEVAFHMTENIPSELKFDLETFGQPVRRNIPLYFSQFIGNYYIYRSEPLEFGGNYSNQEILYSAFSYELGIAYLHIEQCIQQPIRSSNWHGGTFGTQITTIGAAGDANVRLHVQYAQNLPNGEIPRFNKDYLRIRVRKPNAIIEEVSSFEGEDYKMTQEGSIYYPLFTAYKGYGIPANYTAYPQEYTIEEVSVSALSWYQPFIPFPAQGRLIVQPTIMPFTSVTWQNGNTTLAQLTHIGAMGNPNATICVQYLQNTSIPRFDKDYLRVKVRKPNGDIEEVSGFQYESGQPINGGAGGYLYTAYKNYGLPPNFSEEPQQYTVTEVWASVLPHAVFVPTNGTVTVLAPTAVFGGALGLQGRVASAAPLPTLFTFHSTDGAEDFTRTESLDASGAFRFKGIPRKQYTVRIKPINGLAKVISLDVRTDDAGLSGVMLRSGDANDDNVVDVADLLAIINHYNQQANTSNYLEGADFNGDDVNDVADLLLVINNYNQIGD